jgi:hypothetical protein
MSPEVESAAVPSAPKWTNTRSPSTIGVGDAWLFFAFNSSPFLRWNTSTSTTSRPVSTSYATARSDTPLALTEVVSQTRPAATTGDDHPRPGTGVFHVTLRDSLQSSGTPRSAEWPCPVGPRN